MNYPIEISLIEVRRFASDYKQEFALIRFDEEADCMWLAQEEEGDVVVFLDPRRYAALIPIMDDLTCCFGYKQLEI